LLRTNDKSPNWIESSLPTAAFKACLKLLSCWYEYDRRNRSQPVAVSGEPRERPRQGFKPGSPG
jgi:hypothetical protein